MQALAILLCLVATLGQMWAEEYLSNLGTKWPDPTGNSIGDIEVLDYGYGPFIVHFFAGSGLNCSNETRYAKMYGGSAAVAQTKPAVERFLLNAVTFEFIGGPASPWTNISMTVQVYQVVGGRTNLLGDLGNDTVNPTPTQWPKSTTFIDFHPLTNIILQSSSEYFVSLSEPYGFPDVFGLLFAISPEYVSATDWRMGTTTTRVPVNFIEYLKFAVNATAIPGTNSTNSEGTNSMGVAVSKVSLSASMVGSNIVLSWPISSAPSQLYACPGLQSGIWSPVSTRPVIINDKFVVTVPSSGSAYFRLQAQ